VQVELDLGPFGHGGWRLRPTGEKGAAKGASTNNMYFIRSGIVKCTFAEDQDKEYILEFLGEGEILGEIEAICKTPAMSSGHRNSSGSLVLPRISLALVNFSGKSVFSAFICSWMIITVSTSRFFKRLFLLFFLVSDI
jgi:hypothetical protein